MGINPVLGQMLSTLCDGTQWIYAAFWKLDSCSHMLTWEDGYVDDTKGGNTVSGTLNNKSLSILPGFVSLDCNISGGRGRCPIAVVVENMSYYSYSVGEGFLGKIALTWKHQWIFANEYDVPPEYPEQWRVQFAAGIKTILLVPVVSIGVVQLGSLDMVKEDSTIVAGIKHLFSSHQLTTRLDHPDPSSVFTTPVLGPASSALTALCPNSIQLQTLPNDDPRLLDFGQVKESKTSTIDAHFLPSFMVQDDLQQDFIGQLLGTDTRSFGDESMWKTIFEELVMDDSEEVDALNRSAFIQNMANNNFTELSCQKEGSNDTSQADDIDSRLTPEWPIMQKSFKKHQEYGGCNLFHAKDVTDQPFGNHYKEISDERYSGSLNFPFDSELYEALHVRSLGHQDDCTRKTTLSKAGYSTTEKRVPEADEALLGESVEWCMEANEPENLLDAVIASLRQTQEEASDMLDKLPGLSFTQCKVENDVLSDSMSWQHEKSALVSNVESFSYSPSRSSSKSITTSINADQNKRIACVHSEDGVKPSTHKKKRASNNILHKPRPRDRQLIQDRLKELRELIPNGSKCSIDALLDRTIKHMLFLRSVSSRTEKLKECIRPETEAKVLDQAHKNGASWACELGSQSDACPLIVENLEKSGQMIVEMLCNDYSVFLEIAQVMRRLELTILKGVLESRSDELWAHFIVEAGSGFQRMDILWPLMQLLQRNDVAMSRMF